MTTNPTTTTEQAGTDPTAATDEPAAPTDPSTTTGDWLVGDYYDRTAELPMTDIAQIVHTDLYDVRNDDMLPAIAEFDVTADSDGPVPVLRVGIAGLVGATGPAGEMSVVYEAMRAVFGLANHYNRVNLARPDQARFIQRITALRADGEPGVVLVGMMHDAAAI